MKKSKRGGKARPAASRRRALRAALMACALLGACVVTAVAMYGGARGAAPHARAAGPQQQAPAAGNFVNVEVGGRRLRVNAETLQKGPLTAEQARQVEEALRETKSTDGLVETRHEDGAVSMDLQGRFQNVTMAKKNEDGSVSTACVDSPEGAKAFLETRQEQAPAAVPADGRKGAVRR